MTGAITGYIDTAQVTLYAFWAFFAGLIFYLRREDKREGYPLKSDRSARTQVEGFPPMPSPKTFILPHGGAVSVPRAADRADIRVAPTENWPGAPMMPTGNPMLDGVGPGAFADRADTPDLTFDDELPRIVPLRAVPEFFLATEDPDPRGMAVFGADRRRAGVVNEVWIDRSEILVRYVEVTVETGPAPRNVLLPMNFLKMDPKLRRVTVRAITAAQFAAVPGLRDPNQVTLLEEDRILGYYGGGTMYATPQRGEPLL